jgi:hypothetical protein
MIDGGGPLAKESPASLQLPSGEMRPVLALMAQGALRAALPAVTAELEQRVRSELLEAPPFEVRAIDDAPTLNLFLFLPTVDSLEVSFALGQLGALPVGTRNLYFVLPTPEAATVLADKRRLDRLDQAGLACTLDEARHLLARIPEDELIAMVPAGAVLLPAFTDAVARVAAGDTDAVAAPCGRLWLLRDHALAATPAVSEAPVSCFEAAAVLRGTGLEKTVISSVALLDGVRMRSIELNAEDARPLAASVVVDTWSGRGTPQPLTLVLVIAERLTWPLEPWLEVLDGELVRVVVVAPPALAGSLKSGPFADRARMVFQKSPSSLSNAALDELCRIVSPDRPGFALVLEPGAANGDVWLPAMLRAPALLAPGTISLGQGGYAALAGLSGLIEKVEAAWSGQGACARALLSAPGTSRKNQTPA